MASNETWVVPSGIDESKAMLSEQRFETARAVIEILRDRLQDWVEAGDDYKDLDLVEDVVRDLFEQFDLIEHAVDVWFSDYRTVLVDDPYFKD